MGADEVEISLMQFADDTLFLDNPDHANVLCMQIILKCFELVLDLKVNFFKSCLGCVGVNCDDFSTFVVGLNCRIMDIPFVYLGIFIGVNPHKEATSCPQEVW